MSRRRIKWLKHLFARYDGEIVFFPWGPLPFGSLRGFVVPTKTLRRDFARAACVQSWASLVLAVIAYVVVMNTGAIAVFLVGWLAEAIIYIAFVMSRTRGLRRISPQEGLLLTSYRLGYTSDGNFWQIRIKLIQGAILGIFGLAGIVFSIVQFNALALDMGVLNALCFPLISCSCLGFGAFSLYALRILRLPPPHLVETPE